MKKLYLLVTILFLISCSTWQGNDISIHRDDFTNVLNLKNTPTAAEDWSSFFFSDQGAWFGYALPSAGDTALFGSFTGPFLITHGKWLSQSMQKLELIIGGGEFSPSLIKNYTSEYLPGKLKQSFIYKTVYVETELMFASSLTSLKKINVTNISDNDIQLKIKISGKTFDFPVSTSNKNDSVLLGIKETDKSIQINFSYKGNLSVDEENKSYNCKSSDHSLGAGQTLTFTAAATFIQNPHTDTFDSSLFTLVDDAFQKNEERWNKYLSKVLNVDTKWNTPEYSKIAVKSIMTLIGNWRAANGDLFHAGLFPSSAINYFNGFWAWDSWKHSAALVKFEPELAKDQIRAMFDYQNEYGMIADCIYENDEENNWLNTKPPLSAWGVKTVYDETKDLEFVKELFPKLIKYHYWWYKFRDHDKNGICEYGASIGELYAANWESGMDNAVRFDERNMVKNYDNAYSMNLESVDLNAYLAFEKQILAEFAHLLNEPELSIRLLKEADTIIDYVNTKMFNKKNGYYYDTDLGTKELVKLEGPEGWTPLWTEIATQDNAARVKDIMMNENKFNTFIPLPTFTADHPKFTTDGYWRGPVWIDQVYFGIAGLRNYGFNEEADKLTKKLFDNLPGLKDGDAPIRENYNPLTGAGLQANHFSWSAAHLLMLFIEN
ncbi:MAG: trehalase family glycosidase [bacterium]